ncbi:MAG: DUF6485 family protein [Candidatus Omnitrophota bacterium]|nr:hypothetical protein [Candidatus Omnitrophota bacterium]
MTCANQGRNSKNCTCSYTSCSKRGLCCECVQYHLLKNEIPGCFFLPDAEKTYDRSIEHFIRIKKPNTNE